jgi:hypothetical protein
LKRPVSSDDSIILWLALSAVSVVALWLSWPGFATHDTVFLALEAERGVFTTYHPLLNGLLLRALAVPVESFAPYTVVQITLCTLLLGRAVQLVAPTGVRWTRWATVAIWGFSFPTTLYLGMIWKDVPLAYGLTFIAAIAYRLRHDPVSSLGRSDVMLLFISLVCVTSLRHGTVINFLAVPVLFGVTRLKRSRSLWLPYIAALLVWVGLSLMARTSLVENDPVHLKRLQIAAVSQPFLAIVTNKNGYASDDPVFDDRLAKRVFGEQYAQAFTPDYLRNEVAKLGEDELRHSYRAILARTPRLCAMNFGLCVSARIQMMLGTLQPTTRFGGMTFYDLGSFPDCRSTFGMTPATCSVIERYASGERSATGARLANSLREEYADRRTTFSVLYAWNLLPALLLIVLGLVLSSARRPAWAVCAFFAVQLVLPFATAMANDFRYYYFLSPFFAVFLPVLVRSAFLALRSAHDTPVNA